MKKEIKIVVDSTEDNQKIEYNVKRFVSENFQKFKEAQITISDIEDGDKDEKGQKTS